MTEIITIHKSAYIIEQREISKDNPVILRHKGAHIRYELIATKAAFDRFFDNRNPCEWEIL